MKRVGLSVLVMLGFAQVSGTAADYSKMSANELNEALILAATEGHANVVRELVKAKPKVDAINTAFISAAENFPGITTNPSSGHRYRTALMDYLNVMKELIKAGANVLLS